MKKKAALIVCGILAVSFATAAASDHMVMGVADAAENSGSRSSTRNAGQEASEAASTGSASEDGSALSGEAASTQGASGQTTGEGAVQEASTQATSEGTSREASTEAGSEETSEEALTETGSEEASSEASTEAGSEEASEEALTEAEGQETAREASTEGSGEEASGETATEAGSEDASGDETTRESSASQFSDYLTLTVPEDWQDHYEVQEQTTDGVPAVSYYEKTAYDQEEGGLLVRVALYTDRERYLSLPEYTYLGSLTAEDGTKYAVIAEFPSDVQFSLDAQEEYEQMAQQIPALLRSVQAAEGGTYHRGRTRAEQKAQEAYSFASILDQFRSSGMLPNGTQIDLSDVSSSTNQYAILDADGDGLDELVLKIGSKAASDKISRAAQAEEEATSAQTDSTQTTSAEPVLDDADSTEEVSAQSASMEEADDGSSQTASDESGSTDTTAAGETTESLDSDAQADASVLFDTTDNASSAESGETADEADAAAENETADEADATVNYATTDEEDATADSGSADTADTSGDNETANESGDAADGTDTTEQSDEALAQENPNRLLQAGRKQYSDTEDDYDNIATSNYYVFKGDSDTDSHASHLTADGLADLLQDSTEDYTQSAYDIAWEDITMGAVNSLYNDAYVPVGESAQHLNALRTHAYKAAVQQILDDNTLPDGSEAVPYDDFTDEDVAQNHFAVADVDADGTDELLIRITNTDEDSARELIYGYNPDTKELVLEFEGVPGGITYYNNGTLQAQSRYDNDEPSTLWPFQLETFNEESGIYDFSGGVYAWDEDVMQQRQGKDVDTQSQTFPTSVDRNANGRVYFLDLPEEADDTADAGANDAQANDTTDEDTNEAQSEETPDSSADDNTVEAVDDDAVLEWYQGIVGSDAEPVYIDWMAITDDNVSSELMNW